MQVKSYKRRTKSGKIITVKAHNRKDKEGTSASVSVKGKTKRGREYEVVMNSRAYDDLRIGADEHNKRLALRKQQEEEAKKLVRKDPKLRALRKEYPGMSHSEIVEMGKNKRKRRRVYLGPGTGFNM